MIDYRKVSDPFKKAKFAFCAALLFILLAVGIYSVCRLLVRSDEDAAIVRLQGEVGSAMAWMQQVIATAETVSDILDESREARRQGKAPFLAPSLQAATRHQMFGVIQASVIDRSGFLEWNSAAGTGANELYLGDREHFRVFFEGRHGLFIGQPVVGRVSRKWSIQIARDLRAPDGSLVDVNVISIDPEEISKRLLDRRATGDAAAVARLSDGRLIFRSTQVEEFLRLNLIIPSRALSVLNRQSVGRIDFPRASDGRRMTHVFHSIPALDLVVLAMTDMAAVHRAAWHRLLPWAGAVWLSTFLASVLGIRMVANQQRNDRERREVGLHKEFSGRLEHLLSGLPTAVFSGLVGNEQRFSLHYASKNLARVAWGVDSLPDPAEQLPYLRPLQDVAERAFYASVLETGAARTEFSVVRAAGDTAQISLHAYRFGNADDNRIIGQLTDITVERSLAAQVLQSDKLATLGQMATAMAHELSQPLAVISFAAENAALDLEAGAAADAARSMETINGQTERARIIIDHLRMFGRVDSGDPGPVCLNDVLSGLQVFTNVLQRRAGIEIAYDIEEDFPPILGRMVPLEQVFINLIHNAADVLEGRPAPRIIRIAASRSAPGWVSISVTDNGPGIPPPMLNRLFAPFFTTKEVGKGTGLGLSVCHGIIKSLGGSISAGNSAEGGARFEILLHSAELAETAEPVAI